MNKKKRQLDQECLMVLLKIQCIVATSLYISPRVLQ